MYTTKQAIKSLLTALALVAGAIVAWGQGGAPPPFTYQGQLLDNGIAANGLYDLRFVLFGDATNTVPLGSVVTNRDVVVSNGLFTVELDLRELAGIVSPVPPDFPQPPVMEVAARAAGGGDPFILLGPRQKLTPAPWAIYADMATTVPDGSLTAAKFGSNSVTATALAPGAVSVVNLQDACVTAAKLAPGAIVHDCSDYTNCYWNLLGNGNISSGVNFLGTVAGELDPLEFRVNNHRAMLYQYTTATDGPNLIGGYSGNAVGGGVVGGSIGGGGRSLAPNVVSASFGSIGGGAGNRVAGGESSVGGGVGNTIELNSFTCTVGGGSFNTVQTNAFNSTIGGGSNNVIGFFANRSTIAGGEGNAIAPGVEAGAVGGGLRNTAGGTWGTVAGGVNNRAGGVAAAVGGGNYNWANGGDATVAGGRGNAAANVGTAVGGGVDNKNNGDYGSIGGGMSNVVVGGISFATIPGGLQAAATNYGQQAYASGAFLSAGDAQGSLYVVRCSPPNLGYTTTNELFLDGASHRMKLRLNSTWTFDALVAGRTSAGDAAGFRVQGVIENQGGAVQLIGLVESAMTAKTQGTLAGSAAVAEADNVNDALVIKVVTPANINVRWVATVRTAEVIY